MISYLGNVVKYYSKVDYIKTIIIRCLKASRKKYMLIFKLKGFLTYIKFYLWLFIKQLITEKVFMLEHICLQF